MENENKVAVRVEGNKTPRLTFSVSREFESILPEIESMPNMSRFVCEAIYEKLQRTKNPNKDLQDALSHFVQIQSIIGNPVTQEVGQSQWIPPVQMSQTQPTSPYQQRMDMDNSVKENRNSPPPSVESKMNPNEGAIIQKTVEVPQEKNQQEMMEETSSPQENEMVHTTETEVEKKVEEVQHKAEEPQTVEVEQKEAIGHLKRLADEERLENNEAQKIDDSTKDDLRKSFLKRRTP
ncbi:hypothetical protein CVD28_04080 [Bacillus sp. M6-12]|uniref:hypothetical protein n=1 Tax=Bacillus sp. M6-12 TaxID=2054166 RepID=UPI000C759865|nr:hypothetical protein [Bacillus sp. M6-12]PLS19603.1 hypothetical protein CVD28_04080 [Bacillus sp. M6-12]